MAADTVDELSGALKSAFDYYDFGAQLFTDDALTEFQAGAREQIEKAFADLDMSSLRWTLTRAVLRDCSRHMRPCRHGSR